MGTTHKREKTPAQKTLQEQAFYLHIEGQTVREIGAELGINYKTAARYVREEERLRAKEFEENREAERARRVARWQQISRQCDTYVSVPGSGALGAKAKAEENIDKILGVAAPTKIDLGIQGLVDALKCGDVPQELE